MEPRQTSLTAAAREAREAPYGRSMITGEPLPYEQPEDRVNTMSPFLTYRRTPFDVEDRPNLNYTPFTFTDDIIQDKRMVDRTNMAMNVPAVNFFRTAYAQRMRDYYDFYGPQGAPGRPPDDEMETHLPVDRHAWRNFMRNDPDPVRRWGNMLEERERYREALDRDIEMRDNLEGIVGERAMK